MKRAARLAAAALGVFGIAAGARTAWIPAKAALAQILLEDAWRRAQDGEARPVPWPWSDAWPVARLRVPGHRGPLVVLSDASGRSLAFGPGHLSGTAPPGGHGTTVVAGHRDTSFAFLRELRPGDALELEDRGGRWHRYEVRETEVVHSDDARVAVEAARDRLVLVTCWPFDALRPGGNLRFAVIAERVGPGPGADGTGPRLR